MTDLQILRVLSIFLLGAVGYFLRPFQLDPVTAAGLGITGGLIIVFTGWRLRHATAKQLTGAAFGALTAYYSLYFNPLGFDRRLVMQAADLGLWRLHGVPVLDRLVLGVGALRADVSGGGPGQDYYHFASYWQARVYATDFLYLQYRQGLRTFNNKRGVLVDETRLQADDASTHTLGLVGRWHGLTAGVHYFLNLEKADELDDDFFRVTVAYEF